MNDFLIESVFVLNHDFNKIIRIAKINPANLINLVKILVQTKPAVVLSKIKRGFV